MITDAPSATNLSAMARPSPRAAPVMSTRLSRCLMIAPARDRGSGRELERRSAERDGVRVLVPLGDLVVADVEHPDDRHRYEDLAVVIAEVIDPLDQDGVV